MDTSISKKTKLIDADQLFYYLTRSLSLIVCLVLLGIIVSLFLASLDSLHKFGVGFIFSSEWSPARQLFGASNAILGTLVTSFIALLIAVPISFGIAVFISEIAPKKIRYSLITIVQLMSGIPSIIYGMWALFILVPLLSKYVEPWLITHLGSLPLIGTLFQGLPLGISLLSAGIVLAIMVIPIISAVMFDILRSMPKILKESAFAVGATRWEVIWHVLIPYARSSFLGAIILGFGRALGETMAVTFVIGNSHQFDSLLMPGTTIASSIASEFAEASSELYQSALMELGLLLFLITFIVLVIAKAMMRMKKV